MPDVVAANPRLVTGGLAAKRGASHSVVITGVEPSAEEPLSIVAENVNDGRFLLDGEGDAIVIGRGLGDLLGVGVGDDVSILGRGRSESVHQRTMTVVGVYDLGMREAEKGMVFITLPVAQELLRMRDQVTEVAVMLERVGQEDAAVNQLAPALPGDEVDSWVTLRPEIRETLDAKTAYTSFFGIVVVVIAAIGILNVLLMAVFERTREMGVLAALGMRSRQIVSLFVIEGTLIGVVGAVVGCALGALFVGLLGTVGLDFSSAQQMGSDLTALLGERLYPHITLADLLGRGVLAAGIAAIASIYPAWVASRKPPAEVLHHV
jgi:ABC-type lipoprotein release transport system permease subunit